MSDADNNRRETIMRTIRTKVYKFGELSKRAKQKAIDDYRDKHIGDENPWEGENIDSFKKFGEIWPIEIYDWSAGGRGEGVYFRFTGDYPDELENLSGQRLANYIWNNHKDEIYSKKYYRHLKEDSRRVKHRNVKSEQIKTGGNKGKWINAYYSGLQIESGNCALTGYCMDETLLQPVHEFLKKPDGRTFKDLLEDCFHEWLKAFNGDRENMSTDEYITEEIIANEYEFTADGRRF